ncbi:hypothetical protein KIL84_005705 [Mauremys mutica]|uniref:Ig-like domain-containing protein n=1 Tax=Mauremys mutica TaxID=74926 RepID=A0A9D4B477_9SAUR|nr:hypothetical protein KIL84_005705 [Mauremys mutica]
MASGRGIGCVIRFKNLKCLPKSERNEVWNTLSEVLKEQHLDAETTEPEPPEKKINVLLVASDSDNENEHASVCSALDCYRAEPIISMDAWPLEWWLKHEGRYEPLAHLARFLCQCNQPVEVPESLIAWTGACLSIPCRYQPCVLNPRRPNNPTISSLAWYLNPGYDPEKKDFSGTVLYKHNAAISPAFAGHVRVLGDLERDSSLQLSDLRARENCSYGLRQITSNPRKKWEEKWMMRISVNVMGWTVSAVSWTRDRDQIVYHSDEARVHAAFKGHVRYLGDLQHNCSLRVAGLRPSDQGTYRFRFEVVTNGSRIAPNVPRVEVSWPAGKAALREGDGFTLRCQAAALRPVAGYVWSRGDVWLTGAGQDLRVDKAAVSDGGSYVCGVWVSGPGWGYLSLSARESVKVQLPRTPTYIIGLTVVLVLLLLVGLVGVTAWSKMRRKRQGMSSNAPANEHGQSTAGAEFSHKPEMESPYEELQGRTQDIYNELVLPQAGSR